MFTNAGCGMILAVVGLGALAQWAWRNGETVTLVLAVAAAPLLVVVWNHSGGSAGRSKGRR